MLRLGAPRMRRARLPTSTTDPRRLLGARGHESTGFHPYAPVMVATVNIATSKN